jgi:hypothetical protein
MATYTWRFTLDNTSGFLGGLRAKWHTVTLDHPFGGPMIVRLDGAEIRRVDEPSGTATINFKADQAPCRIEVRHLVESFGGIAKMDSWTHDLSVKDQPQKPV